ncbi:transmembrane protein 43 homolog [Condylostylus longicornis]|uniref:transmembrane protein 43 homolog n=1 Tax=Condylostylus longicornis TaxID=2530218 RepID=UPI00244D9B56|nr:transmembrane protein 43 homolog [Condylostylus longicornis]
MPNTTSWLRSVWPSTVISTVLLILGSGLLFWNEGRSVKRNFSLMEALNDAITIDPNSDIDPTFSKRLVHFYGQIVTGEPLTEPEYNIQVQAVKLKRKVQMYQWVEETIEHNYGQSIDIMDRDERTYYYTQSWEDHLINSRLFSSPFTHRNPENFPIESHVQLAETVYIGKYELSKDLKIKFDDFQHISSDQRPDDPTIKLHQGFYFHSNDVFNPEIGDLRLLFSAAGMEGEYYTVVGCIEEGNKIVPYYTSYKTQINFLFAGKLKLTEVFDRQHKTYRLESWISRFIGWFDEYGFYRVMLTNHIYR